MSQERRFKKGEVIFKEGDVLPTFYVLQSGRVSLFLERGGQKIEVDQPIVGHVIGEQGVFGFPKQVFNAEAQSEVKVVEIPLDPMKTVYEKSPGPYKLFVKALGDELRRLRGVVKSFKMDADNGPCPSRMIPRLCSIVVLVAEHTGQKPKPVAKVVDFKARNEPQNPLFTENDLIVNFNTLKIYTSRMFLESASRMQSFCELLSKLGYLSIRAEKNEDTELMEVQEIRIHDKATIEQFGEFYQHNFFRAGKSEAIHVDKTALLLAMGFTELAASVEPDRNGVVQIPFKSIVEHMKTKYLIDFKDTHASLIEKKGLYAKRQTIDDTVMVSFDKHEWQQTAKFWQIILEIDRWNETGSVNLEENLTAVKPSGPERCAGCGSIIQTSAKFCPECGHKLAA